jgi:hypothetical protein
MNEAASGNINIAAEPAVTLNESTAEILAFAHEGNWPEFQARARKVLRKMNAWQLTNSIPTAAWLAISDFITNEPGDLEEANALIRQGVEMKAQDPALVLARAFQALAYAKDGQAETMLSGVAMVEESAFRAVRTHLELELAGRRNQLARKGELEALVRALDPENRFRPRWQSMPVVAMHSSTMPSAC